MSKVLLMPCLLVLLLTSCAQTGKSSPLQPEVQVETRITDTACSWTRPIFVDKTDVLSDETAKQILAHNKAGAAHCGWKPTGK